MSGVGAHPSRVTGLSLDFNAECDRLLDACDEIVQRIGLRVAPPSIVPGATVRI